jgi:hypothetical protein
VSQTSRSSFPKPARWNKPDAVELFNMLRLVLCHSRAPIFHEKAVKLLFRGTSIYLVGG